MSFTNTDQINATLYTNQRHTLSLVNKVAEKYKHIGTHLDVTVRAATLEDYYFPANFTHRALMVEVKINESLCERLSCNSISMKGPCEMDSEAHYYRLGEENRFDVACQPSCYNLFEEKTYDKDKKPLVQMMRLIYNKNKCIFVSPAASFMEVPRIRSEEKFKTRVNDLPAGFNRTYTSETQDGLSYEMNKTYCDAFFDTWIPEEKKCTAYANVWDFVTNVVIGESLIKTVKGGFVKMVNNGNSIINPGFPEPPPIDPKFLLNNWLNDVNDNFIELNPNEDVDVLIIKNNSNNKNNNNSRFKRNVNNTNNDNNWDDLKKSLDDLKSQYKLTSYNIPNDTRREIENTVDLTQINKNKTYKNNSDFQNEVEDLLYKNKRRVKRTVSTNTRHNENIKISKKQSAFMEQQVKVLIADENKDENKSQTRVKNIQHTTIEKTPQKKNENPPQNKEDFDPVMWASIKLNHLIKSAFESLFTDPLFISAIGFDVGFSTFLSIVKSKSSHILKTLTPRLAGLAARLARPIGLNVFNSTIKITVSRVIAQVTIKVAGAIIRNMAKFAVLASSIIGWVLLVVSILDITFALWDPLGFNNKYPEGYLKQVMEEMGGKFRQNLEVSSLEFTFNILAKQFLLSKDDVIELSIDTFHWTLEYLDTLTVNSEGSLIDKGQLVKFSINADELETNLNIETVKFDIYTPEDFNEFEQKFMNRVRLTSSLQVIGITIVTLGLVTVALQMYMVALLIILIGLFTLLVSRLNMDFDLLVENLPQEFLNQVFNFLNR